MAVKSEKCTRTFVCVRSCGYVPWSVKWQMQWEPCLVGWDDIFQQTGLPWLIPWKVTPADTKLKVSESDEIPSNGIKLQQQMFLGTKCIHKGISYLLDANLFQI